jgi:hypothetical protein
VSTPCYLPNIDPNVGGGSHISSLQAPETISCRHDIRPAGQGCSATVHKPHASCTTGCTFGCTAQSRQTEHHHPRRVGSRFPILSRSTCFHHSTKHALAGSRRYDAFAAAIVWPVLYLPMCVRSWPPHLDAHHPDCTIATSTRCCLQKTRALCA